MTHLYIELLCCGIDSSLPLQAMKYLSYALLPLCIGLAVYNLLYTPHKRYAALVFDIKPAFIYIGRLVLYPDMTYTVHVLLKVSITPNMSVEIVGKLVKCYVLSYGKQFWTFTI